MIDLESEFDQALPYAGFLAMYGTPENCRRWENVFKQFQVSDPQRKLLQGFVREMNILCLAGAWCGDCADQCPILERFAQLSPRIHLRFMDRDADPKFAEGLRICGGSRVPVAVFLSEDFAECARFGDRTLSRYRALAGETVDQTSQFDEPLLQSVASDWFREFERIQLMLRLSPRLRQKHGD